MPPASLQTISSSLPLSSQTQISFGHAFPSSYLPSLFLPFLFHSSHSSFIPHPHPLSWMEEGLISHSVSTSLNIWHLSSQQWNSMFPFPHCRHFAFALVAFILALAFSIGMCSSLALSFIPLQSPASQWVKSLWRQALPCLWPRPPSHALPSLISPPGPHKLKRSYCLSVVFLPLALLFALCPCPCLSMVIVSIIISVACRAGSLHAWKPVGAFQP